MMAEGRLCQILLLDDRKLELLVQPRLLSRELLDLVSSHFNLKEKEYFGLTFIDDTGQCSWLQLDRRVLDHDFPKKSGPIALRFLVRFYIESFSCLKDNTTVELFFLNAKSAIYNGDIEVESEDVFKLAAFALQEAKGDYSSDENTRAGLKKLPTLPTRVLKEHPSLAYCEDRVTEHYRKLSGLTRGQAVVQYLKLVESLATYGVHYYTVKDKQGIPWWLGVSYKGIGQYDLQDKLKPRKLFQWKQLENLYFREKKFAVEVHDPHRRTVSRRTFGQAGLVIHSWYATHSLIKTIWVMAISQHQFYLDRKQSKAKISTARSLGDIALELTESGAPRSSKLGMMDSTDRLIMASNGSLVSAGSADSEVSEEQKREKILDLKKKEKELQEILTQKMEDLKQICLKEAELTGILPKEYPLPPGEKAPKVRRRVGTTFKLDEFLPFNADPDMRNLESKFALQQKIVEAAKKLADEPELCKTVKKKRRRNLLDAIEKLQVIEDEINKYRIKLGKKPTQRASVIMAEKDVPDELKPTCDLHLDNNHRSGSQRQRSHSVQYSPQASHSQTFCAEYQRRASANDPQDESLDRLGHRDFPESQHYSYRDTLSTHSSPCKTQSRQHHDARSMPATPVLTRNAYSSVQLRSDDSPQFFRQRSGSLESQSQFLPDVDVEKAGYSFSPSRRSNSTELLDDGSSYTSQSSAECSAPGSRTRRRHRKGSGYANTGSMPNLAHADSRSYGYGPLPQHVSTAYYVTGYPSYADPEPHSNGTYVYESELEGHYNVNPSYPANPYVGQDRYGRYLADDTDGLQQNFYATLRPTRTRQAPRGNHRNFQKALVAEQLRGWYNRTAGSKLPAYEYERGSQHSLGYQTMPAPFSHPSRAMSYSSVSSASSAVCGASSWRSQVCVGLAEYDVTSQQHYTGSHSSLHSRYREWQRSDSRECQQICAFLPDSPSSSSSSSSLLSSLPSSSSSSQRPRSQRPKLSYAKCSPR